MPKLTSAWLRTATCVLLACIAGIGTSVAVASKGSGGDDDDGTTTGETTTDTTGTTNTTGTTDTTNTTDTTDTTDTTNTTTSPYVGPPRAPRIREIEADWRSGGRIKLRAELVRRGAKITKVRFRYRGRGFTARKAGDHEWAKTVTARGGDTRGDVISFRVRACAGERCKARTGSDEAGG
jgi:hypothetical protein